jgi:glycosyltransferase involved in cell wall biosynthesis
LELRRFDYAPRRLSTLTGRFGILENIREQPARSLLVGPYWAAQELALRDQLEAFMPHRVVAHFLLPAGLGVARLCGGRVPFEVFGHGTDVDLVLRAPAWLRRRVASWLEAAEQIHLPSTAKLERLCRALGWAEGHPMRPRVRVEMMSHVVAPMPSSNEARGDAFLFLGRLIEQKGVDTLIRAAAHSREKVRLVIAGDGPKRDALEALAEGLGVDAEFCGWVVGEEKRRLLQRARALILPSQPSGTLGEGAPLVLAEAHAAGTPIVASDLGGVRELLSHLGADARLVPPGDPVALARAMSAAGSPTRHLRSV